MTVCSGCRTEQPGGARFCAECGSSMAGPACGSCGEALSPTAKFCNECGASVGAAACGQCGAALGSGAKFCNECGAAQRGGGPAARPLARPSAEPVSARRVTSVLFGDLVGFTTLSESRDQEEVRELLSAYFDQCRADHRPLRRAVEKFIGDAVMAVWGVPDCARGRRGAAGARRRSTWWTPSRRSARTSASRTWPCGSGIVTGEVAVTIGADHQGMVAGDAVNTASRVQSVATAGQVLVDETTRLLTAAAITYVDVGSHRSRARPSRCRCGAAAGGGRPPRAARSGRTGSRRRWWAGTGAARCQGAVPRRRRRAAAGLVVVDGDAGSEVTARAGSSRSTRRAVPACRGTAADAWRTARGGVLRARGGDPRSADRRLVGARRRRAPSTRTSRRPSGCWSGPGAPTCPTRQERDLARPRMGALLGSAPSGPSSARTCSPPG